MASTQYIIERMAELQLLEQEARTRRAQHEADRAQYEAANARLVYEHNRRALEPPPAQTPPANGLPS